MVQGLQITISSEELRDRISQRIIEHEENIARRDVRLQERVGDMFCDVRAEDDFKTVGDLQKERQQFVDRVTQLTLLRDHLILGEIYALSRRDLRLAELISPEFVPRLRQTTEVW